MLPSSNLFTVDSLPLECLNKNHKTSQKLKFSFFHNNFSKNIPLVRVILLFNLFYHTGPRVKVSDSVKHFSMGTELIKAVIIFMTQAHGLVLFLSLWSIFLHRETL